jgi:hypothetical protein
VGLLRKSKPDSIKFLRRRKALVAFVGAVSLVGVAAAEGAKPPPTRLVRISVDTTSTRGAQHATEVEPDAVAVGQRVVATYQVGRYFGGGAGAIGFATSTNAGRTWRSGLLPSLTATSFPPGPAAGASDPVVAYDALHRRWLVVSLSSFAGQSVLFVSGSPDGLAWEAPAIAIAYPRNAITGTSLDKEWITCDNGPASPFRGRCYIAYTDIAHDVDPDHQGSHIAIQSSADGGQTWSPPVLLPVNANIVSPGVQPVVRPNGELVVVFLEDGVVQAARSNDGGLSFSERERVSGLAFHQRPLQPNRFRAFVLPSVTVDAAGTVYAAWFDCRFRSGCATDDIVISRSAEAGRWTSPRRVPLGPLRGATDFVVPDLAVDPQSRGARARLALTYHAVSSADCTESTCLLDVFLVTSKTAGARWTKPRRLNPRRMRLTWLAETASGRMVGDYVATVFAGKRVVSVHAQARAPQGGRFNEGLYAFSLALP